MSAPTPEQTGMIKADPYAMVCLIAYEASQSGDLERAEKLLKKMVADHSAQAEPADHPGKDWQLSDETIEAIDDIENNARHAATNGDDLKLGAEPTHETQGGEDDELAKLWQGVMKNISEESRPLTQREIDTLLGFCPDCGENAHPGQCQAQPAPQEPGEWHADEIDAGERGLELWIFNKSGDYIGRGADKHNTKEIVKAHNEALAQAAKDATERACKAVCEHCRDGYGEVFKDLNGYWGHRELLTHPGIYSSVSCDAHKIREGSEL